MDSHLYPDYLVPPNYDSLLGKLIVWGEDREQVEGVWGVGGLGGWRVWGWGAARGRSELRQDQQIRQLAPSPCRFRPPFSLAAL